MSAPIKSQSLTRRPILLRQPEADTAESAQVATEEPTAFASQPIQAPASVQPAPVPVAAPAAPEAAEAPAAPLDPQAELTKLRQKVENYRSSLQQWIQAEVEWSAQRRIFEMMTENVPSLIVLTNREGNRLWSNPAYSKAMGYPADSLLGTYVLTEVDQDEQGRVVDALNQTIQQGATKQIEYRVQQKEGTWVTLDTTMYPILNADGKVETILLISDDITERKRLSEELAHVTTEATATGMIQAMIQDFDQIITNVIGNLAIAKNLNGPHNAIAIRLNEMERSLQRARDLVEQMLTAAPEQGHLKTRISLETALEEPVASVVRGTMARAEYLFPRNLPELDLDTEAFARVIRNIVTNSVQAMDKGVIRFTAETISREQLANRPNLALKPDDYICLKIQDQGHGIAEKALPRVFEPYFTTRKGSQGLGLTQSLTTIQRMGGSIQIDSTPGVGTIVSIFLPIAKGEPEIAAPEVTSDVPMPARTGPVALRTGAVAQRTGAVAQRTNTVGMPKVAQKKRILLMDDEQMILDIVSRMLGHLGYDVTTCTDGSQAIAAFAKSKSQSEPFDVVMMDLVIPNGVGGQDAVHTIKKIDPGAKVIASSGHLDHPVMLDYNKFGFNAVLEKPYKLEKLQQVIEAVINTLS